MPKLYAYVDEAANLADENQFFIIGVVSTHSKKELRRILKRARKVVLGRSNRQVPEIKSSRVVKRVAAYVIKRLVQKDVAIYVWIVDKEGRKVADTPENYGLVLGYALKYGFKIADWDKVWVDKKYTKERDVRELNQILASTLGGSMFIQEKVVFTKSEKEPGLGLADFVAGSFYAAYNQSDDELVKILQPRVVMEEKVLWRKIKQKATAPRGSVAPM